MTSARRVLILGGTGMLGHEVVRRFATGFEVHATARDVALARSFDLPATVHAFDAHRPETLASLLEESQPAAVVNCIGLVKQLPEGNDPIQAITINSLFPHQLAAACRRSGVRLLQISTDCVFSGELPLGQAYAEQHAADARDVYGRTKLLGEVVEGDALTFRTSIVGWELTRASGLLEWFAAQDGETIQGFRRALFSGLTTGALAEVLVRVVSDLPDLRGLYHVASEPISKLDLLGLFRDRLGVDCEIEPVDEPVVNRVLDPSRFAQATGFTPPDWPSMLDAYLSASPPRAAAAT